MLPLVESFFSFQGEGKYAGSPSVFIRLGGCNFTCKGFGVQEISPVDGTTLIGCDSQRAVSAKHFKREWTAIHSSSELMERIWGHCRHLDFIPDLIITGGEPLLHFENPILYEAIEKCLDEGFRIHVETNASVSVDFGRYPLYQTLIYAMSVKLSNSGEPYHKRVQTKVINSIIANSQDAFFKFVLDAPMIESGQALREIEDIIEDCFSVPVFCMPLGNTAESLSQNDIQVAEFCIKKGYNYMDRIHIRLWNNRPGV